jgi:hypothetical protein
LGNLAPSLRPVFELKKNEPGQFHKNPTTSLERGRMVSFQIIIIRRPVKVPCGSLPTESARVGGTGHNVHTGSSYYSSSMI